MVDQAKVTPVAPAPSGPDGLRDAAATTVDVKHGQALLVAQFSGIDDARAAYDALRTSERTGALDIDGVLVITADVHGRIHVQEMTQHTTRHGLRWGAAAGAAIGLIFPPAILVGAVVGAAGGGALGKAYSIATRDAIADELATVIPAGSSGIVVLVGIDAVDAVHAAIPAAILVRSTPIDPATAEAIGAAAQAGGGENGT